jgi:hypothetical protein
MSDKVLVTMIKSCYVEDVTRAAGDVVECSPRTAEMLVRDRNGVLTPDPDPAERVPPGQSEGEDRGATPAQLT